MGRDPRKIEFPQNNTGNVASPKKTWCVPNACRPTGTFFLTRKTPCTHTHTHIHTHIHIHARFRIVLAPRQIGTTIEWCTERERGASQSAATAPAPGPAPAQGTPAGGATPKKSRFGRAR